MANENASEFHKSFYRHGVRLYSYPIANETPGQQQITIEQLAFQQGCSPSEIGVFLEECAPKRWDFSRDCYYEHIGTKNGLDQWRILCVCTGRLYTFTGPIALFAEAYEAGEADALVKENSAAQKRTSAVSAQKNSTSATQKAASDAPTQKAALTSANEQASRASLDAQTHTGSATDAQRHYSATIDVQASCASLDAQTRIESTIEAWTRGCSAASKGRDRTPFGASGPLPRRTTAPRRSAAPIVRSTSPAVTSITNRARRIKRL